MTANSTPHPLIVVDQAAWREWLLRHEGSSDGTWLMLAKKGTTEPTVLSYQAALEEALCGGWIDGQRKGFDAHTFMQRFTPRRSGSVWSQRNVDIIVRLETEGRLRERGRAEVEGAQADGRWARAYAGAAAAEIPEALAAALALHPSARAAFDALSRADRYSALHPILTAPTPGTLSRRVARLIDRLASHA